jgi:hypothetical protein
VPLTHKQALAVAGVLLLAGFEEPGTISAIEHEAAKGAEGAEHHGVHVEHGKLIQMHVKTPQGEKFYKLPIGSLIIAHPGHLHGAAAEHSKLIQAGEHKFAVPKTAKVMVPKDTDLSDEHAVAHAPKHVILHSPAGEERHAHISPKFGPQDVQSGTYKGNWKELPGPDKKPVHFGGKPAAWVPHDWKIYKSSGYAKNETGLSGKFAKDPDGKWHLIAKDGQLKEVSGNPDLWVKTGSLVPDEELKPTEHIEPSKAGPSKIEVGGVPVTHDEIHKAISLLNASHSTQVKQPLKAAGHPLQHMDYHGVSKEELAKHPELKVSKGSKAEHVGQVKIAVLHHLAEKAKAFPQTQAQESTGETVQEEAHKDAEHAQKLTPAVHSIGGVAASKEDIEAAIGHLGATESTAIKQTLLAKGNPLGKSDYWAVVNAHKAAFPNATKDMKAKPVFIAALKHHLQQLAKEDEGSGYSVSAGAHELIDKGHVEGDATHDQPTYSKAVAHALKMAHQTHKDIWVVPHKYQTGKWQLHGAFPHSSDVQSAYKVTPQHDVGLAGPDGKWMNGKPSGSVSVAGVVNKYFKPGKPPESETKGLEPSELASAAEPESIEPEVKDFTKEPGWDKLHELITSSQIPQYEGPKADTGMHALSAALAMASDSKQPWHVSQLPDSHQWKLSMSPGTKGSFASPGDKFYTVTPDHQVTLFTKDGQAYPWDVSSVHEFALGNLSQKPAAEPEKPAEAKTLPVLIDGKEKAQVPEGSKIYTTGKGDAAAIKYVKAPDGAWSTVASGGSGKIPASHQSLYDSYLADGVLKELKSADPGTPDKVPEAKPDNTKPVMVKGEEKGQVPADAQIYYKLSENGPLTADTADKKYVKLPDGSWQQASGYGMSKLSEYSWKQQDKNVADGAYQEEGKEAPDFLTSQAKAAKLWADLKSGTVDPKSPDKGTQAHALAHAAVLALNQPYSDKNAWVWYTAGNGQWKADTFYNGTGGLKVSFSKGAPVLEQLPGPENEKTQQLDAQQVYDAVGQHVTTSSVIIGAHGSYGKEYGTGQQYKQGFYYKPKGSAFLEIKAAPGYHQYSDSYKWGSAAKAQYIWHGKDGTTKEITPTAAAAHLETATEYHATPKEASEPKLSQIAYASTYKPGQTYKLWSDITHGPDQLGGWEAKEDGSNVLTDTGGNTHALDAGTEKSILEGGGILDAHGTTVVKPGIIPSKYHLFGGEAKTPEQMKELLTGIEQNSGDAFKSWAKQNLPELTTPGPVMDNTKSFLDAKLDGGVTGGNHREALMGLLRELLAVPHGQEGDFKGTEPVYLKSLPPGIHSPKDLFQWTDQGLPRPEVLVREWSGTKAVPLWQQSSPDLKDKIAQISAAHGDGKVVGTHVSSLTKDQREQWLLAWSKGDMQTVFGLDAKGGKVSPAHPGAPANEVTHQMKWAPWDPSQVPATDTVPGEWSDQSKVTLPLAEVHNYLIKAGLQHPEHLMASEQRQFVTAHREHDQEIADHLTRLAQLRWKAGDMPVSKAVTWTDDLQPAKTYDTYLEENTPAGSWTGQALFDYAKDNWDKLEPFDTNGYGKQYVTESSTAAAREVIQRYLDDAEAKKKAELSIPVWTHSGEAPPVSGSKPIMQLTRTIPLTGEKSEWFFKPALDSHGNPAPFRAEIEHAGNELGKAFGFRTPDSTLITFEGQFGQAQRKLDAVGDMAYGQPLGYYDHPDIDWSQLSQREISDIAREHALDWVLANDDSRASNLLRMPDGSIVGIDKGRAWRDFGTDHEWQGLSKQADTNCALMSTALYNAVRNHQISKEVADQAYIDTMQRAQKMSRLPDARLAAIMRPGIEHRPGLADDAARDALVQKAIDRKNALPEDMGAWWGKVYADAGWTLPEVPDQKLPEGAGGIRLYSGFSEPEFADAVKASKSYGTPAFFGGTDLQDGNFLVWHEYRSADESKPVMAGDGQLRGEGLSKAVAWAKAHQTGGPVSHDTEVSTPDLGGIKGEAADYDKIINAAKTVSHHVTDKQFNPDKMNGMQQVKDKLTALQKVADTAIAAGPDSDEWKGVATGIAHPVQASSMAQYYLDHIAKIEEAKDTGHKFAAGDLPRWMPEKLAEAQPAEKPAEKPAVKVVYKSVSRPGSGNYDVTAGDVFDDNGELHATGKGLSYGGKAWHITLPTGEEIELHGDGSSGYTQKAHQGRVRFTVPAEGGSASLERVRDQLQSMGVNLPEAEEHDLHLFYWRHLGGILANRSDSDKGDHGKVWDSLKTAMTGHKLEWNSYDKAANLQALADSSLTPDEELAIHQAAWAHVTSPEQVKEFTEAKGWLPHQDHFDVRNPEAVQGKPYWMRFDVDPSTYHTLTMPAMHSDNSHIVAQRIVHTGGRFSTEARMRALGSGVTGMSSSEDMSRGSSGQIFTRLGQETESHSHVLLSPSVLARTSTYSFSSDNYGDPEYRSSGAPFRLQSALKFGSSGYGSNETMVRDAVSLLDGTELMYASPSDRPALISYLKDHGITEIRGVPVEDRIVTKLSHDAVSKVRAAISQQPGYGKWGA